MELCRLPRHPAEITSIDDIGWRIDERYLEEIDHSIYFKTRHLPIRHTREGTRELTGPNDYTHQHGPPGLQPPSRRDRTRTNHRRRPPGRRIAETLLGLVVSRPPSLSSPNQLSAHTPPQLPLRPTRLVRPGREEDPLPIHRSEPVQQARVPAIPQPPRPGPHPAVRRQTALRIDRDMRIPRGRLPAPPSPPPA